MWEREPAWWFNPGAVCRATTRQVGGPGGWWVENALAALQWKDTAWDRQAFIDYVQPLALEGKADRDRQETEVTPWAGLRSSLERGWYFGTEALGDQVLEKARETIGQRSKAKQNYHGAEVHDHGERESRRIIAQRLLEAGLRSLDLGTLAKGDPRKVRIAKSEPGQAFH